MSTTKYLFRIERMHHLIRRKSTGCPEKFAEKMELSRSMLMNYLSQMKELGAPITYDNFLQSYVYEESVEFCPFFKKVSID